MNKPYVEMKFKNGRNLKLIIRTRDLLDFAMSSGETLDLNGELNSDIIYKLLTLSTRKFQHGITEDKMEEIIDTYVKESGFEALMVLFTELMEISGLVKDKDGANNSETNTSVTEVEEEKK